MKKNKKQHVIFLLFVLCTFTTKAQSELTSSFYFMENFPLRQKLNPAFQPQSKIFISLPIFGYGQARIDNNLLTLAKAATQRERGKIVSILFSPEQDRNFYDLLHSNTAIGSGVNVNLFCIGFRALENDYWIFSSSIKSVVNSSLPISPTELILYKDQNKKKTANYSLGHLGGEMSVFSYLSAAYSTRLNKKWTIGAKLSLLIGHLHIAASNTLMLNTNDKSSQLEGNLSLRHTIPGLTIGDKFKYQGLNRKEALKSPINGIGTSIDIGVSHKTTENLSLSISLNEIGTIRWFSKNSRIISGEIDHSFDQISVEANYDIKKIDEKIRELVTETQEKITKTSINKAAYSSPLSPSLNISAEYAFYKKRLSLGLISNTLLYNKTLNQNISFVVNTNATQWLDLSVAYSLLNGQTNNIGAAVALRSGVLQWFFAVDHSPFFSTKYNNRNLSAITDNKKAFNFSAGVNILLESDEDKARNKEKFGSPTKWKRKKKSKRTGLY